MEKKEFFEKGVKPAYSTGFEATTKQGDKTT